LSGRVDLLHVKSRCDPRGGW